MQFWVQIEPKELARFLELSGDKNPLHYQGLELIPGNLLMLKLQQYLEKQGQEITKIVMDFIKPVYLGQPIMFKVEMQTFQVLTTDEKLLAKGRWQ